MKMGSAIIQSSPAHVALHSPGEPQKIKTLIAPIYLFITYDLSILKICLDSPKQAPLSQIAIEVWNEAIN